MTPHFVRRTQTRCLGSLALLATLAAAPAHAAVSIDLAAGTTQGDRLFDPASASYAASVQQGHRIEVRRSGPRLELRITPPGAAAYAIALPEETVQLRQVRVTADRIVVIGWMNGALASDVTLFDRLSGRSVDRFWAYAPSVSPDGRQIAFVKFFPSHFIEQWESQYRLYDLTRDAESNRPSLRAAMSGEPATDRLADVGIALYPLAAAEIDRAEAPAGQAHERGSPFAWAADSRQLAFVDVQGGAARLVTVRLPVSAPASQATQVAALPEFGTLCGQAVHTGCRAFSPDWTRVDLGNSAATVSLRRPGANATPLRVTVEPQRFSTAAP